MMSGGRGVFHNSIDLRAKNRKVKLAADPTSDLLALYNLQQEWRLCDDYEEKLNYCNERNLSHRYLRFSDGKVCEGFGEVTWRFAIPPDPSLLPVPSLPPPPVCNLPPVSPHSYHPSPAPATDPTFSHLQKVCGFFSSTTLFILHPFSLSHASSLLYSSTLLTF